MSDVDGAATVASATIGAAWPPTVDGEVIRVDGGPLVVVSGLVVGGNVVRGNVVGGSVARGIVVGGQIGTPTAS